MTISEEKYNPRNPLIAATLSDAPGTSKPNQMIAAPPTSTCTWADSAILRRSLRRLTDASSFI
jgi:hypothetical protein